MSESANDPKRLIYTFPNMAYSMALNLAFVEQGIFRRPKTEEERNLHLAWAAVDPNVTDEFHGTEYDMTETAKLLRDWGELTEERVMDRHFPGEKYGRQELLKLAFARIAVRASIELDFMVVTGGEDIGNLDTARDELDFDQIYDFLNDNGEAA